MKENKLEAFLITIMAILIVGIVIFTIYKVSSSTMKLRVNEPIINNESAASNKSGNNSNSESSVPNLDENEQPQKKEEVMLSTFSTNIYDNDTNRVDNIALAISSINGKILNEDEVFSFNGIVGPMDYQHGYKDSTAFDSYGNKIKVPGGGMCQISSTIYNAALEGGLEIDERHPHSRRVEYVPVDRDATIYYDTLDFKFKNTSGYPLKIVASSDVYNVTVTLYVIK